MSADRNWKEKAFEQDLVTLNGPSDSNTEKLLDILEKQKKWDVATCVEDGIVDPSLSQVTTVAYSYLDLVNSYNMTALSTPHGTRENL